jgi:hypothetical protein
MTGIIKRAVSERIHGKRPNPARAIVTAAAMGVAAAGITYRVLRG